MKELGRICSNCCHYESGCCQKYKNLKGEYLKTEWNQVCKCGGFVRKEKEDEYRRSDKS